MKRYALALLLWLAVSPCWAAINVCTETQAAIDNGEPFESGDDITEAIQECWDNTTDPTYADPYIPAGNWSISSTIVGPHRAGYSLRGEGGQQDQLSQDSAAYRGTRTSLIWVGADGGTMFEVRGKFVRLFDMSFKGAANTNPGTNTADRGILVTKGGGTAIATGWMNIERCSFFIFNDYAIQLGATEGTGENNCENIAVRDCLFDDCGIAGIKLSGSQQLGNSFDRCRFQGTMQSAIYATGGGKTVCNQLQVLFGNVDRVFKANYVVGGFGPNNGDFTFRDTVIDNQIGTNDDWSLFEVNTGNVKLRFDGGLQSCYESPGFYDYSGTFGKLTNNSTATFSGMSATFTGLVGATSASVGGVGGTPVFRFRDCNCFNGTPTDLITGTYRVQSIGNMEPTGAVLADYPLRNPSSQVVNTTGGAVGVVTSGSGEQTYGQQQPIVIDMQAVLTKYNKTIDDVTQADVTLKFRRGIIDNLADYDKNSVDDSEVTYAMEDVTVADGSTESHLIVRATVPYASFGGANLRADRTYYIGCSLSFTGLTGSFEPDTMTGGTVKYTTQRVD